MPMYEVSVRVEYKGHEYYEIEADDEAHAIMIAKQGDQEPQQELECSACYWEKARVKAAE